MNLFFNKIIYPFLKTHILSFNVSFNKLSFLENILKLTRQLHKLCTYTSTYTNHFARTI